VGSSGIPFEVPGVDEGVASSSVLTSRRPPPPPAGQVLHVLPRRALAAPRHVHTHRQLLRSLPLWGPARGDVHARLPRGLRAQQGVPGAGVRRRALGPAAVSGTRGRGGLECASLCPALDPLSGSSSAGLLRDAPAGALRPVRAVDSASRRLRRGGRPRQTPARAQLRGGSSPAAAAGAAAATCSCRGTRGTAPHWPSRGCVVGGWGEGGGVCDRDSNDPSPRPPPPRAVDPPAATSRCRFGRACCRPPTRSRSQWT